MPPKRKVEDLAEEMAEEAIEDYKAKRKSRDAAEAVRKSVLAMYVHLTCRDISEILRADHTYSAVCGSSMVEIFIGADNNRTTLKIPKDLLAIHSEYFYNRFKDEDEDLKMDFPIVDPAIFGIFQSWLYCGQIVNFPNIPPHMWFGCWSMGQTFLAPGFQNHIMDNIRRRCKVNPGDWITVPIVASAFQGR